MKIGSRQEMKKLPEVTLSQGGRGLRTCSGSDWTVARRSFLAASAGPVSISSNHAVDETVVGIHANKMRLAVRRNVAGTFPMQTRPRGCLASIPISCERKERPNFPITSFAVTHSCRRGGRIWHSRERVKCVFCTSGNARPKNSEVTSMTRKSAQIHGSCRKISASVAASTTRHHARQSRANAAAHVPSGDREDCQH